MGFPLNHEKLKLLVGEQNTTEDWQDNPESRAHGGRAGRHLRPGGGLHAVRGGHRPILLEPDRTRKDALGDSLSLLPEPRTVPPFLLFQHGICSYGVQRPAAHLPSLLCGDDSLLASFQMDFPDADAFLQRVLRPPWHAPGGVADFLDADRPPAAPVSRESQRLEHRAGAARCDLLD